MSTWVARSCAVARQWFLGRFSLSGPADEGGDPVDVHWSRRLPVAFQGCPDDGTVERVEDVLDSVRGDAATRQDRNVLPACPPLARRPEPLLRDWTTGRRSRDDDTVGEASVDSRRQLGGRVGVRPGAGVFDVDICEDCDVGTEAVTEPNRFVGTPLDDSGVRDRAAGVDGDPDEAGAAGGRDRDGRPYRPRRSPAAT